MRATGIATENDVHADIVTSILKKAHTSYVAPAVRKPRKNAQEKPGDSAAKNPRLQLNPPKIRNLGVALTHRFDDP